MSSSRGPARRSPPLAGGRQAIERAARRRMGTSPSTDAARPGTRGRRLASEHLSRISLRPPTLPVTPSGIGVVGGRGRERPGEIVGCGIDSSMPTRPSSTTHPSRRHVAYLGVGGPREVIGPVPRRWPVHRGTRTQRHRVAHGERQRGAGGTDRLDPSDGPEAAATLATTSNESLARPTDVHRRRSSARSRVGRHHRYLPETRSRMPMVRMSRRDTGRWAPPGRTGGGTGGHHQTVLTPTRPAAIP